MSLKLGVEEEKLDTYIEHFHSLGNEKELATIDAAYTGILGPTTTRVTR